jgi:hypothetical protein
MADLTEDEGYELIFNAHQRITELDMSWRVAATEERERLRQELDGALQAYAQLRNQENMKRFFEEPNHPKLKSMLV